MEEVRGEDREVIKTMKCITGKKCFEEEFLALEALIQNHIFNDYSEAEGPINIYQCHECDHWHFTSKGLKHEVLNAPETKARIKRERQANYWERKIR